MAVFSLTTASNNNHREYVMTVIKFKVGSSVRPYADGYVWLARTLFQKEADDDECDQMT